MKVGPLHSIVGKVVYLSFHFIQGPLGGKVGLHRRYIVVHCIILPQVRNVPIFPSASPPSNLFPVFFFSSLPPPPSSSLESALAPFSFYFPTQQLPFHPPTHPPPSSPKKVVIKL